MQGTNNVHAAPMTGRNFAIVLGCLLAAVGCDKGGLLVPESRGSDAPAAVVPQATELVNGGNVATNGKYKMVAVNDAGDEVLMCADSNRENKGMLEIWKLGKTGIERVHSYERGFRRLG